jgi:hypothetical protein
MGMKLGLIGLVGILLLTGCGQSDEAKAKALVLESCNSTSDTESLIRKAVDLDEKYRPYLLAWLEKQNMDLKLALAKELSREVLAQVIQDSLDNQSLLDSYCKK